MKLLNWFKNNKTLTIIVIIASFLRLYHLDFQSIWLDELLTMNEISPKLSFKEASDIILFQEGTPRFYFFFVKVFNSLFGYSVYNARLVSVLFGLLSVIFINKLGKKLFNPNVGLFSSVFLAFNLFLIDYSQEARTYSMLVFFVILGFYYMISFINERNYKNAILLGVSVGLITNAHPFGLINVATIYLILLYVLFTEKESKVDLFKKIFLSGLVFILIFIPVIPTILRVSEFTSFWIIKPNPTYLFQIFNQLLGSSLIFTFLFIAIYFVFVFKSIQLITKKEQKEKNKHLLGFIIINSWIWFEVAVILIKSYFGISIALSRYFIAIVPAFILIVAVSIDFIKNNLLKQFIVLALVTYLASDIFLVKDFYSIPKKSQFDSVTNFIIKNNTDNNKVVSSLGWLLGYYINNDNQGQTVTEMNLEDYVTAVKNNAVKTETFWYMDGNSKPFTLSADNEAFLKQNFKLVYRVDRFDAWARCYAPIKNNKKENQSSIINFYNNDFTPLFLDGNGNLMIFENSEVTSSSFDLDKGKYILTLLANSLPSKPIDNENAHIKIKINQEEIGNVFLSENINNKTIKIPFNSDNKRRAKICLIFDNDVSKNGLDRNVVIYSIKIEKK